MRLGIIKETRPEMVATYQVPPPPLLLPSAAPEPCFPFRLTDVKGGHRSPQNFLRRSCT